MASKPGGVSTTGGAGGFTPSVSVAASVAASHTLALDLAREANMASDTAEEAAQDVMDLVVNRATDLMIGNHFDRLSIPYTVKCVTKELCDFIQLAFVGQDDGSTVREHWHADPQAPQVAVDPWARAALSVQPPRKREAAPLTAEPTRGGGGNRTRAAPAAANSAKAPGGKRPGGKSNGSTPSPLDTTATMSTLSLTDKSNGLDATAKPSKTSGRRKSEAPPEMRQPGDNTDPTTTNSVQDQRRPTLTQPFLSAEEIEYNERIKREQKQKQDAKMLSEKIARQMEELKGAKDIMVDSRTGKVVPIKQPEAGNAKIKTEPKFALSSPNDGATAQLAPVKPPANVRGKPQGGSGTQAGGGTTRRKRETAADFFAEDNTTGPMITELAPSGGVMLKDTDGAIRKSDLGKKGKGSLSRSEYRKLAEASHFEQQMGGDLSGNSPSEASIPPPPPKVTSSQAGGHPMQQAKEQPTVVSIPKHQQQQQQEHKPQGVAVLPNRSPRVDDGSHMKSRTMRAGATLPSVASEPTSMMLANTSPARGGNDDMSPRQQRLAAAKAMAGPPQPHRPAQSTVQQHSAFDDLM